MFVFLVYLSDTDFVNRERDIICYSIALLSAHTFY